MAYSSSGNALDEILADKHLFESQLGISYAEAIVDSDVSDLEVEICEDWGDDDWSGDKFDGRSYLLCMINCAHVQNLCVYRCTGWLS